MVKLLYKLGKLMAKLYISYNIYTMSNSSIDTILLIFNLQSHSQQNPFPELKFDVIPLLGNLFSHGTMMNIQRTLRDQ